MNGSQAPDLRLRCAFHYSVNIAAHQHSGNESADLAKLAKDKFDPKAFLAKVGAGKSISKLGKGQNVFVQGDVADGVFYIQKGKIKLGRF